jgi:RNA polymerase sigma factor (sigma-70 family)
MARENGNETGVEPAGEARELFEANLPLIRSLLGRLCAHKRLPPAEAEDFTSYALLRMIENDYAVLRRFEGRSTLGTYLVAVSHRLLLDYRNQRWGKWHPSAAARRLGGAAVRLEALIHRDGCTVEDAIAKLLASSGGTASCDELAAMVRNLPPRVRRRVEGMERLAEMAAPERADDRIVARESAAAGREARAALARALDDLSAEDRRILEMRYQDGRTVRDLASELGLEARRLYRRIEISLRRLRGGLEAQGITRQAVHRIRAEDDCAARPTRTT